MSWFRGTVLCRYSRDGSQHLLAGGSEGDGDAGGGHGAWWSQRGAPAPSARTEPSSRSACPRVLGVLADCHLVPATGRSSKRGTPGLRAHSIRTGSGPHSRMQVSPCPRTRQSTPVTCLKNLSRMRGARPVSVYGYKILKKSSSLPLVGPRL